MNMNKKNVSKKNADRMKLISEIEQLTTEQNNIKNMFCNNQKEELEDYITNKISNKYAMEKIIHNIFNPVPVRSYYEYVNTVYMFLENIKNAKKVELSKSVDLIEK
ncbi:MAG: hypothetical protein IKL73_01250 [Lachnospiraceae bacterium]|nr:hypothetical protein [Lachnospiraceae bacterium]